MKAPQLVLCLNAATYWAVAAHHGHMLPVRAA